MERLNLGNLVLTAYNGPRAVMWIGKGKVLSTRGRQTAATPVIRACASAVRMRRRPTEILSRNSATCSRWLPFTECSVKIRSSRFSRSNSSADVGRGW